MHPNISFQAYRASFILLHITAGREVNTPTPCLHTSCVGAGVASQHARPAGQAMLPSGYGSFGNPTSAPAHHVKQGPLSGFPLPATASNDQLHQVGGCSQSCGSQHAAFVLCPSLSRFNAHWSIRHTTQAAHPMCRTPRRLCPFICLVCLH